MVKGNKPFTFFVPLTSSKVLSFDNKNKNRFLFCIVLTYLYLCTRNKHKHVERKRKKYVWNSRIYR